MELNLNLNLGFNLGLGSGDRSINGSGGGSKEIGCVSRRSVGVQTDPISELDLGSGSSGMSISSSPSPSKIKGKRKGRDVLSPKYLRRGRSAVDLDVDEVSTTNAVKADVLGGTSASLDKEKVQPEEVGIISHMNTGIKSNILIFFPLSSFFVYIFKGRKLNKTKKLLSRVRNKFKC